MEKKGEKTNKISLYIKTRTKMDGTIYDQESIKVLVSIMGFRFTLMLKKHLYAELTHNQTEVFKENNIETVDCHFKLID